MALIASAAALACENCGRLIPQKAGGGPRVRTCKKSPEDPAISCAAMLAAKRWLMERYGQGALTEAAGSATAPVEAAYQQLVAHGELMLAQLDDVRVGAVQQVAAATAERDEAVRLRQEADQRAEDAAVRAQEADERARRAVEASEQAERERTATLESARRTVAAANAEKQEALVAQGRAEGAADELATAMRRQDELVRGYAAEVQRVTAELQTVNASLRTLSEQALDAEQRAAKAAGLQRDLTDRDNELAAVRQSAADLQQQVTDLTERQRIAGEQHARVEHDLREQLAVGQRDNEALLREQDALRRDKETAVTAAEDQRVHMEALMQALSTGGFERRSPSQGPVDGPTRQEDGQGDPTG